MILWFTACGSMSKLESNFDFAAQSWCSEGERTRVLSVYDGDTITVEELSGFEDREDCDDSQNQKIRFLGVSAPEIGSEPECYGDESSLFLASIVEGEQVDLEFDVECVDMFCRRLGWVFLEGTDNRIIDMMEEYSLEGLNDDGSYRLLVNELIIRSGHGVKYRNELDKSERYADRIERAEEEAQEDGSGLWSNCSQP